MKKNLVAFFGLSRWGVGAVALALCAFTPASRADVDLLNNLPGAGGAGTYTTQSSYVQGGGSLAQQFKVASAANISSVTLSLVVSVADSASVYLYDVTTGSGLPLGLTGGTLLGSVNQSSFSITGLNVAVNNSDTYAIILGPDVNGHMSWNATANSGNTVAGATVNGGYYNNGLGWTAESGPVNFQMEITAVPEVPMTGAVMGFGVLAVAVCGGLRRKLRPAVSSVA
jgi:hypothetical protein